MKNRNKAFTLVELIISIAIFAFMTAFLLAKYGKFDQNLLLTNLAYDVALSIRTAQSYGISVKDSSTLSNEGSPTGSYYYPYGVYFNSLAATNKQFIFFSDNDADGLYGGLDTTLKTYTIKKNSSIVSVCASSGGGASPSCTSQSSVSITFKRPEPNAIIKTNTDEVTKYAYAEIVLRSSDNSTKRVVIRNTGQIAVTN